MSESVALLGPTNTGKTHRAVERMLEYDSGMIGLPLRLLAREVYDRVAGRVGQDRVALITGEEKRVPRAPDYWICTTEAMPLSRDVDFLAVDEVQLMAHEERGHVFTDRVLHARGVKETWFLGAATIRPLLAQLLPAAKQREHPRLSKLSFSGSSKLSRLPPRTALVAFSLPELYALAGRLRSLKGGTAVVLGALSPRARNAQVALFQAGEVDYLVATDAIGMGLNLQVEHVAFASLRKFDGQHTRTLDDAELAQIAGRAGRWLTDGTFGTVLPLELERARADAIVQHRFEPLRRARYRNSDLDFSSTDALIAALRKPPPNAWLSAAPPSDDLRVLERLSSDEQLRPQLRSSERVALLWQVCQIPDFRKILFERHLDLLRDLFERLSARALSNDFMGAEFAELDRVDGDGETLMARMARLRTWAFVAHQSGWVQSAAHWQGALAALEDRLSDALHRALTERFVERRARAHRTARAHSRANVTNEPETIVTDRNHPFAELARLRDRLSAPAPATSSVKPSTLDALVDAPHEQFVLEPNGAVIAAGQLVARLVKGQSVALPEVKLLELGQVGPGVRSRLERRLLAFARDVASRLLEPVRELLRSERGVERAIAYQLEQGLGTATRAALADSLGPLDERAKIALTSRGIVLGELSVYVKSLLNAEALEQRRALLAAFQPNLPLPARLGAASYRNSGLSEAQWLMLGYVLLGPRAIRADLAERALGGAAPSELGALGVPRAERRQVQRALDRLRPVASEAPS